MRFVSAWLVSITAEEFLREGCIVASKDRMTCIGDESLVEGHVVDRAEDGREDLVGGKQVMDVRTTEAARACVTVA